MSLPKLEPDKAYNARRIADNFSDFCYQKEILDSDTIIASIELILSNELIVSVLLEGLNKRNISNILDEIKGNILKEVLSLLPPEEHSSCKEEQ